MKNKISIFISRLKNIWAWGAYKPDNFTKLTGYAWSDTMTQNNTQFLEPISFKEKFEQAKNIDNLLEDN